MRLAARDGRVLDSRPCERRAARRALPREAKELVTAQRALPSVAGKLATLAGIAVAFFFALVGTVYLSLRSPEVKVPEVVGKSLAEAESALEQSGLNVRTRARRYSNEVKPDTVLDQAPRAGETVKAGQTVAIVVSRAEAKEGESSVSVKRAEENKNENANQNESASVGNANGNKNENKPKRAANRNRNTNNANANATAGSNVNSNLSANLTTNSADRANAGGTRDTEGSSGVNHNTGERNLNATPPRNANAPREPDASGETTRARVVGERNANTGRANANVPRTGTNVNRNTNRRPPGD